MVVRDFTSNIVDGMFRIVDANKTSYLFNPSVLYEGDRNVVNQFYGDRTVICYEAIKKNWIALYIK